MLLRAHAAHFGAALLLLAGCQSARQWPNPEAEISAAVGTQNCVVFRSEGGPIDAPAPGGTTLTLEQAVRLAVENDPTIQAALARTRIAQAEAKQAGLLPNPVLSVSLRFPEGGGKPNIEAGLMADLIAVLQRPGLTSAADNRLRAASAAAVQAVLDVVSNVEERYVSVQSLDAQLSVLEERRALVDRLLELSRARLRGGEGTRLDELTLRTQQVELITEIAERSAERRDERLLLARLIGRPSDEAAWTLPKPEPAKLVSRPEREWVETALRSRPEISSRRYELAALGDERALTQFAPFTDTSVGVDAERDNGWSVGPQASLPIPLFDTGQARRERATAALIEGRHKLTEASRQVVEEVRRAYAALQAHETNLTTVRTDLLPLQEQRRQQAESQFRVGETDSTSLLIAEQDLRATRLKLVELERRVVTAQIRLERAVGGRAAAGAIEVPSTQTAPVTALQAAAATTAPLTTN